MLKLDNATLDLIDVSDDELKKELAAVFGDTITDESIDQNIETSVGDFKADSILKGKIIGISGNEVVVDVGLKSEGYVPVTEWDDPSEIDAGDEIEVLLEALETDSGGLMLSKRKADRIRGWERLLSECKEGDKVEGKVMRKIKGGLLVDIGVPVFLPASQVDTRRPGDVGHFIGKTIEAVVLKIDEARRNIVISRRKLIETERAAAKSKLMAEIEVGQIREGIVKNIADFGAFIDLGGIDGLLHITDMSWDRIGHPSEMLKIDQKVNIKVLNIDKEKEKIALGLKQTTENPWEKVGEKYPVGSKITGTVVNITPYGAFVRLESGIEGLVHISEMSWTRRINHPSEILQPDQDIEVVVLEIDKDKQEISLGIKQTETNPWTLVAEKYPPNTVVTGTVRNLTNYGAFIEIEEGIDGLLHVSDMSWTKKISHPSELLKKGEEIKCVVLSVDQEKARIALGLKQLTEDPWLHAVPERYIPGMIVKGKVTKITNFGVFVELEEDLEGLLHVSELSDEHIDDPHQAVEIGQELEVKILRVDTQDRKIGLSKKRADWATQGDEGEGGGGGKSGGAFKPRRGGLHGSSGEDTTDMISATVLFSDKSQIPGAAGESAAKEEEDESEKSE
ncbi:MAG TPA: 30S ribosomal protein S1 [Phycisphaerae bacterium]|nr:30S ribosomal protein S1 [Phycisphaerae bacterium]HRW53944.1 30S ribosomal protein S1 [Phycisphaerae bacterium]